MSASFHALYATERRVTGFDHPKWQHNDKLAARRFALDNDVRPPDLLQGPAEARELTEPTGPCVVKPIHGCGGRGVLPLIPHGDIWRDHLHHHDLTWTQAIDRTIAAVGTSGLPETHPDKVRGPWIVEEYIDGPEHLPVDWKFYCFGGKAEVIRSGWGTIGTRAKWWHRDWTDAGDVAHQGTPGVNWHLDPSMEPPRHAPALLKAAERLATAMLGATHFVRIDLYEDDNGPVFGEITPHPSGAKMRFIPEWDARLGRAWMETA